MKTFLVAAVLAVSVTPVMAGNGWNYGSSSSSANCGPKSYDNYNSSTYRSNSYGSNNYGSRLGYGNSNRWSPSYNTRSTNWNGSTHDYDYHYPATRNTRYDNQARSQHHHSPLTFSPWSQTPSYSYNRRGY